MLSISTTMTAGGWDTRSRWIANIVFSLMCPLGAIIFFLGVRGTGNWEALIVGTALLFSAGVFLCIALADLLKNVAGWMYVVSRRPFRVDDRIEVEGMAGDVIDIRLFRTILAQNPNLKLSRVRLGLLAVHGTLCSVNPPPVRQSMLGVGL